MPSIRLRRWLFLTALLAIGVPWTPPPPASARQVEPDAPSTATQRESDPKLADVVREAFRQTHDGWSSDEVLIRDELNESFIAACRERIPEIAERDCNWALLNLRKAGKLDVAATRTDNTSAQDWLPLAEIAARSIQDREKVTIDAIMADPELRAEFDDVAAQIDAAADAYLIRKGALRLRKTRQLRPELITRIADWDRKVIEFSAAQVAEQPDLVPELPGVYLFRDRSGYLYIGEAIDLRERLQTHLQHSDRRSLAGYLQSQSTDTVSVELHVFPADSRMREIAVRRAYESELIRSRQPRFNVRP